MSRDPALLPVLSFEIEPGAAEVIGERLAPFVDAYGVDAGVRERLLTLAPAIVRGLGGVGGRLRVEADISEHDVQLVIGRVGDDAEDDHQLEVWARFSRT